MDCGLEYQTRILQIPASVYYRLKPIRLLTYHDPTPSLLSTLPQMIDQPCLQPAATTTAYTSDITSVLQELHGHE
jgi:hypothetical protein